MPITLKRERVSEIPWTSVGQYQVWAPPKGAYVYRVEGLPDWFDLPIALRHKFGNDGTLRKSGSFTLRPIGLRFVSVKYYKFNGSWSCRVPTNYGTLKNAIAILSETSEQDLQQLYFQFLLRIALGPDRDKLTETQLAAAHVASHTIPHERRT